MPKRFLLLFFVLSVLSSLSAQRTLINPETTLKGTNTAGELLGSNGSNRVVWLSDAAVDNQELSLSGSTLSIENGNSVDLSGLTGSTQTLTWTSASGSLSISDGNTVDLSELQQTLSLSSNTLSLSDGGSVSLAPYLDNTDAQTLSISNDVLSITGGNTVSLSSYVNPTEYYQEFDDVTGSTVTVTVNGGTLPTDLTKIRVDRPGIRCTPTNDFTVSGSTITFIEPLQSERVQIRFAL